MEIAVVGSRPMQETTARKSVVLLAREFAEHVIQWTKLKIRVHGKMHPVAFIKERDIWWAHLGVNIGHEQDGKNEKFERPVLVVKTLFGGQILWVIPITTKEREDGNYFFRSSYVHPDGVTVVVQYAILPQMRAVSPKRFIRKLRVLPEKEYRIVVDRLKNLLDS